MGRTSGFTIDWPVRIPVEDGRTFIVERVDDGSQEYRACAVPLMIAVIAAGVLGTTIV